MRETASRSPRDFTKPARCDERERRALNPRASETNISAARVLAAHLAIDARCISFPDVVPAFRHAKPTGASKRPRGGSGTRLGHLGRERRGFPRFVRARVPAPRRGLLARRLQGRVQGIFLSRPQCTNPRNLSRDFRKRNRDLSAPRPLPGDRAAGARIGFGAGTGDARRRRIGFERRR